MISFRLSHYRLLSLLCLLLLFNAVPCPAAETAASSEGYEVFSVTDCINMADSANPAIGLTIARLQEAGALVKEARSHLFPEINYNLSARRYADDPGLEGHLDYEGKEQMSAALSFSWPVYSWNRLSNNVAAEEHEQIARKWELLRVREKAIHEAIAAYWTLASSTESRYYLDITIHELELFQESARADLANEAPNALEKDVLQIEVEINKMQAWLGTLDRWYGTAAQGLAIAIGRPALRPRIADNIVRYKKSAISYNACLAAAWQHRAELKASAERIKSAGLQIDINRRLNWPTLSLFAKGMMMEDGYSPSQESTGVVGLSLKGTIFDGFRQDAKTARAQARYRETQSEHRLLQDEIRQQVYSAYLKVKEAYRKLVRFRQARHAVLQKLELVRSGYAEDVSDVEDVLETQVERRFRDRDYIFTKLNLLLALNDLNLACGARIYDFSRHERQIEDRQRKTEIQVENNNEG